MLLVDTNLYIGDCLLALRVRTRVPQAEAVAASSAFTIKVKIGGKEQRSIISDFFHLFFSSSFYLVLFGLSRFCCCALIIIDVARIVTVEDTLYVEINGKSPSFILPLPFLPLPSLSPSLPSLLSPLSLSPPLLLTA